MTKNITFSLPAEAVEGAHEAILLGDFNNWNPEKAPKLEQQADGSYKAIAQLEEGKTYHYRFLLDNGKWVNDYHAQKYEYVPGLYVDNCVITIPQTAAENKKEQATKTTNTKVVKAEDSVKEEASETESPKTKAPKKAKAKTEKAEAPKAKKAKAVNAKVVGESEEKTKKTRKKATPKDKTEDK